MNSDQQCISKDCGDNAEDEKDRRLSNQDRPADKNSRKSQTTTKHVATDEDKKYVSQAVAFFVRHSQKGVISLCASLANLLREQDMLKRELRHLQKLIQQDRCRQLSSPLSVATSLQDSIGSHACLNEAAGMNDLYNSSLQHSRTKVARRDKLHSSKPQVFIKGCICKLCSKSINPTSDIAVPPIKYGDKAVIRGEILGTVKYVGHVDEFVTRCIYVGMELEAPIGDSDGTVKGKTYFTCQRKYGHFSLLQDILCLV